MSSDAPEIEDDPDRGEFQIEDPEEYNQARRLKTIHQARDDVRKARKDVIVGKAPKHEHTARHMQLAEAVATYGYELLPLMNEAGWEYEVREEVPFDTIREFIHAMGNPKALGIDADYMPKATSMQVYGRLNEFMHSVGLGADFDSDTDEWEV